LEAHPDCELVEEENLAEIHWGEWEGTVSPLVHNLLSSWEAGDFEQKAPFGESPFECENRAVPAIYEFIMNRPEKDILFVGNFSLIESSWKIAQSYPFIYSVS
jgi:broad specificity phosphatase PhoE